MPELERLTTDELRPLDRTLPESYPERLRDMSLSLYCQLLDDMPPGDDPAKRYSLARLAYRLTERLSTDLGGSGFYMHKGHLHRLSERDKKMCSKFRGNNIPQLAKEYNLSDTRVRQILHAWTLEQIASRQGVLDLPAPGNEPGPHCRDCADIAVGGVCPDSGKPCARGGRS